jgi:hypothetical protein
MSTPTVRAKLEHETTAQVASGRQKSLDLSVHNNKNVTAHRKRSLGAVDKEDYSVNLIPITITGVICAAILTDTSFSSNQTTGL